MTTNGDISLDRSFQFSFGSDSKFFQTEELKSSPPREDGKRRSRTDVTPSQPFRHLSNNDTSERGQMGFDKDSTNALFQSYRLNDSADLLIHSQRNKESQITIETSQSGTTVPPFPIELDFSKIGIDVSPLSVRESVFTAPAEGGKESLRNQRSRKPASMQSLCLSLDQEETPEEDQEPSTEIRKSRSRSRGMITTDDGKGSPTATATTVTMRTRSRSSHNSNGREGVVPSSTRTQRNRTRTSRSLSIDTNITESETRMINTPESGRKSPSHRRGYKERKGEGSGDPSSKSRTSTRRDERDSAIRTDKGGERGRRHSNHQEAQLDSEMFTYKKSSRSIRNESPHQLQSKSRSTSRTLNNDIVETTDNNDGTSNQVDMGTPASVIRKASLRDRTAIARDRRSSPQIQSRKDSSALPTNTNPFFYSVTPHGTVTKVQDVNRISSLSLGTQNSTPETDDNDGVNKQSQQPYHSTRTIVSPPSPRPYVSTPASAPGRERKMVGSKLLTSREGESVVSRVKRASDLIQQQKVKKEQSRLRRISLDEAANVPKRLPSLVRDEDVDDMPTQSNTNEEGDGRIVSHHSEPFEPTQKPTSLRTMFSSTPFLLQKKMKSSPRRSTTPEGSRGGGEATAAAPSSSLSSSPSTSIGAQSRWASLKGMSRFIAATKTMRGGDRTSGGGRRSLTDAPGTSSYDCCPDEGEPLVGTSHSTSEGGLLVFHSSMDCDSRPLHPPGWSAPRKWMARKGQEAPVDGGGR